jgi:hypothetical protein
MIRLTALPIVDRRIAQLTIASSIADLTIPPEVEVRGNCDPRGSISSEFRILLEFSLGLADAMPGGVNPKTVELQARTRRFAASVIAFCEQLPRNVACQRITAQLIDAANAADSNYRGACKRQSPNRQSPIANRQSSIQSAIVSLIDNRQINRQPTIRSKIVNSIDN